MKTKLQHYQEDLLSQLDKVLKRDQTVVDLFKYRSIRDQEQARYSFHFDRLLAVGVLQAALQAFKYPC